jgi:hypothetical protein
MNKCIAAYPKTIIIIVASKAFKSDLLNIINPFKVICFILHFNLIGVNDSIDLF